MVCDCQRLTRGQRCVQHESEQHENQEQEGRFNPYCDELPEAIAGPAYKEATASASTADVTGRAARMGATSPLRPPFATMAVFHASRVSRISSVERHTWERSKSLVINRRPTRAGESPGCSAQPSLPCAASTHRRARWDHHPNIRVFVWCSWPLPVPKLRKMLIARVRLRDDGGAAKETHLDPPTSRL